MKIQKNVYVKLSKVVMLAVVALMVAVSTQLALVPQSVKAESPTATPAPLLPKDGFVKDEKYLPRDDVSDKEGGAIDIKDLSYVAGWYGTTNPAADVNGDGVVDIKDLAILGNNYNKTAPEAGASAIVVPTPLPPTVDAGKAEDDFNKVISSVQAEKPAETKAQSGYNWRPLKVGVGIDHVYTWDLMDGETHTPPDFYAVVGVGGSVARTATLWNKADIFPYWMLGWWQYAGFARFAPTDPMGDNYSIPITLEIRDDDGQFCYGYLGCRWGYEVPDLTPVRAQRVKRLAFIPSSCRVIDEAGVLFVGAWDGPGNRCRVNLTSWGDEWPRASVTYHVDALWE